MIETIQAFLDRRVAALPDHIRSMRQRKQPRDEESQQSEFDSIVIAFTTEDLLMLGEEMGDKSPIIEKDKALAEVSRSCPSATLTNGRITDHCNTHLARDIRASFQHVFFQ